MHHTIEHKFYYKEGNVEGEAKTWWCDGVLCVQSHYKNGNKHGEYKTWSMEGILDEHKIYKNGKIVKDLQLKIL